MITLFTTFFLRDEERQKELLYCLNKNVENIYIDNIYLLLDGKNEEEIKKYISTEIKDISKINYISVGRIPTYGDWIQESKRLADNLSEISVFINADIYLDETIFLVKNYLKKEESVVCLTRHEVLDEAKITLHENPQWSQDLWAISKENILNINNSFFINELESTRTGSYRCDNKIAFVFAMRGWVIFNPYPEIKIYHVQKNPARAYRKLDLDVVGGLCFPSPTNTPQNPSSLDISIMPVKKGNIVKCAINTYLERNLFPDLNQKQTENPQQTDIVFFGASVTKQKEGYVAFFKNLNSEKSISVVAVGATHIKDAGVCLLEQVIQRKPKYCFLDWFTPSLEQYSSHQLKDYLFFIIRKLFDINCVPVFLFLNGDGSGHNFDNKIKIFNTIINEVCEVYNIPYIKVYEQINQLGYSNEEILKDEVHTNLFGAELYATLITEEFKKIVKQVEKFNFSVKPEKNKYSELKIKQLACEVKKRILFKGDAEIVGIFQKIGPFTGWVEIKIDGKDLNERCLVDKHCYYTRECFNFSYKFNNFLEITLSAREPDYNVCKNPKDYGVKDWDAYYKRHLKKLDFKEIYYIGEITEVIYE